MKKTTAKKILGYICFVPMTAILLFACFCGIMFAIKFPILALGAIGVIAALVSVVLLVVLGIHLITN